MTNVEQIEEKGTPFIFQLSQADSGTLTGIVNSYVMYRFEIQRLSSIYSKYVNIWGVPTEVKYTREMSDKNAEARRKSPNTNILDLIWGNNQSDNPPKNNETASATATQANASQQPQEMDPATLKLCVAIGRFEAFFLYNIELRRSKITLRVVFPSSASDEKALIGRPVVNPIVSCQAKGHVLSPMVRKKLKGYKTLKKS